MDYSDNLLLIHHSFISTIPREKNGGEMGQRNVSDRKKTAHKIGKIMRNVSERNRLLRHQRLFGVHTVLNPVP